MASRTVIRSVLTNFLGTYLSRYSDYQGYWLFGFLLPLKQTLKIDLLTLPLCEPTSAINVAQHTAVARFHDQLQKGRLERSQVRSACLDMSSGDEKIPIWINGRSSYGYRVTFLASAVMDTGREYRREVVLVIAPHNSVVESRSTRVT